MEKIVTQIGDVTIERRVTKAPTQKFDSDAAVKNTQSRSAAKVFTPKYKSQDQIKSLPPYEVLKEEKCHPGIAKQYNLNVHAPVLNRNFNSNAQIQMGKNLVAQTEMEQKLSLPKEILWDRKRMNNAQEKIGYGNQYDEGTPAKSALTFENIKSACQSEKVENREGALSNAMEAPRHGGNNVDYKRATNVEDAKYFQSGNTICSKLASLYNTSLSSDLSVERINRSEGLSKPPNEESFPATSQELAFRSKKAHYPSRGQNFFGSNNHEPFKSVFQSNYPVFSDASNQNFPNWRKLTQAGLTIEKKSNSEDGNKKFPVKNSYNSVPQGVQKKAFTSKSPIHISSDEEKQTGEDTDYDLKELEDFEEGFDNDSDGYEEEEDVNAPVNIIGEYNREAPTNPVPQDRLDEKLDNNGNTNTVKHIKTFRESFCQRAENISRKGKFHQRSGSPIVLSSEDDDKNDEDFQIVLKESKNSICQKNNLPSNGDQHGRKLNVETVQDAELSEIIELEESLKAYESDFLVNSHEIDHFLLGNLKRDQEMRKAPQKPLSQQGQKRNSSLSVEKANAEFLPKRSNRGEQKLRKSSESKDSDTTPDEDAGMDQNIGSIENEDIEKESGGKITFPEKDFTNDQLSNINISKDIDTYQEGLAYKTGINDKLIKQEKNSISGKGKISNEAGGNENLKASKKDNHQNIQLKMEADEGVKAKETSPNFSAVGDTTIQSEVQMPDSNVKQQKSFSLEKNEILPDSKAMEEIEKSDDMNELVCNDLMELMKKGEIEGEVEDDKDYESDEEKDNKKTGTKRRSDENEEEEEEEEVEEEEDGSSSKKSKCDKSEENDEGKEKGEKEGRENEKVVDKSKVTSANLRKNIREVMDETKLDEATLSAQRQEAERLKRLQEQQRIIRELQKQIALNRQNQKSQSRVLSLLQGNSQTSILKTSSSTPSISVQSKSPNHVLVKLSNGQQTSLNNKKMMELLKNSKTKTALAKPAIPKTLLKQGMVSPSVSIAPIAKKEAPVDDKKKKKGDVVTLSSDSEDDCIVLSEEDESEPEEDPANSGMHTSDKYNVPDERGRVIVNVGHPESEKDLFLAPQIARIIKPHQIGGIRFLYDNVIESLERFQSSTGFGCILAHSMGLGKTLQIVSFSDIFLRYTSAKTILCIMPINTIQNWLAEFNMWLPKENNTDQEIRCRDFDLFIVNESLKNINSRSRVILDWHKNGGVLLMGYELFRLLSLKKSYKSKKKRKESEEKEDDAKNKELFEELYAALVRPGPDLVICDEGHRIKNSHATTSQALKQIRTKRRIVLTGYPLQNNLLEYWCMVDFVRPNYLGSKAEFSNMFERPIQNGQCIDSTPQDKRLMRYRAHVLHSLLEGFVQRRSHAVLQSTLPEKEEYVLLLRFTPFQRKLYDTFMNEVVRTVAVPNPLKAFAVCCKIWNHPDVLYNFLKKKGEEIDLDLEEALPSSLQPSNYPFGQSPVDGVNQFSSSPQGQAWPRRGPGSRGGKIRQCATTRRQSGQRGRKPAATVSPNSIGGCEKKEQESENYTSNNYNTGFSNFAGETLLESERRNEQFVTRDYNQYPSAEFGNPSTYGGAGYETKNPLENLENLSSGDFQNKRFYHHQMESGIQAGFTGASCLSMQRSSNFPQNISQSNNSNMKNGFNSNPNGNDSRFSQSDAPKLFEYNQDFNSSFYHGGNFQTSQSNIDFERSKNNFSRNNQTTDSNSYFQNSQYVNTRENNLNFNMQQSNNSNNINSNYSSFANESSDQNFQQGGLNKHYQTSSTNSGYNDSSCTNSGLNYPNSIIGSQTNSCSSDVQNKNNYNGTPTNCIGGNDSNFQGSNLNCNSGFSNSYRECSNFNSNQPTSGRNIDSSSNFKGNEAGFINRSRYPQGYWSDSGWHPENFETNKNVGEFKTDVKDDFLQMEKYNMFNSANMKMDMKQFLNEDLDKKTNSNFGVRVKSEIELDVKSVQLEDDKTVNPMKEDTFKIKKEDECKMEKKEEFKSPEILAKKEDQSLPYDWATDLFKNYVTGIIENSSKMTVFFHILTESINLGDRILVFSQSLLTLDLIEDYLQCRNVPNKDEKWMKHRNYFRLDGSTPGLEREKLINEFNGNPNIFIFLVSTRAGSLGINLVGANRVVVFDASWNPCHDTQAVCRVYRYGQQKPCFVYRLVMDNCLEKKIYDRQINKQGMADRVVDELNPDAHLSIKEVTNLCWDDQEDTTIKDFASLKHNYKDHIIKGLLENCSKLLSKEPFQHESLLIDRKEKKLSQAEKRLAKRSYELEKQAANQPKNMYSFFPNASTPRNFGKPIASVRPMQSEMNSRIPLAQNRSKWIPAEVWQKQGMSAQEMTLPLDVVIPTNTPDKTSIVLKAGQRVMVLKSPKGIYMQLENGKIIAIRTAFKVGQSGPSSQSKGDDTKKDTSVSVSSTLKNNPNLTITSKSSAIKLGGTKPAFARGPEKKVPLNFTSQKSKQVLGKAKPFLLNRKFQSVTAEIKQRLLTGKTNMETQEDKLQLTGPNEKDEVIITNDKNDNLKFEESLQRKIDQPDQRGTAKPDEPSSTKGEMSNSLETLRKVTENITDECKSEDNSENSQPQVNQLKNYRHNFSSQMNTKTHTDDEKGIKTGIENEGGNLKSTNPPASFNGNENVQNWFTNQSYPPVDPYSNYFPGYYNYASGAGPIMNPYDSFYPNNYNHPMGRSMSGGPSIKQDPQSDASKSTPQQQNQPPCNQNFQQSQNPSACRNSIASNPSMYPPYPNPYSYPYNYPTNSGFSNQGYSFSAQNQSSQQPQLSTISNSTSSNSSHNQTSPYDTSMYSAFHRPDSHFQAPESQHPPPYHRQPYPGNPGPGFFPYNSSYRSYRDQNYHYGANFNSYMHPPGYGYHIQNPPTTNNNQSFNQTSTESSTNSN